MNDYEQKKQDRIERLHGRADSLRAKGAAKIEHGRKMLDVIPFGQPILIGHHSERGDRRYRGRAVGKIDQGCALLSEADETARRAAAAESNTAISSDDPEAVTKLRAKLAELEAAQERDKAVNKIVLPELRKGPSGEWEARAIARLVAAQICGAAQAKLYTEKDFAGRYGVPDYRMKNRSAEIRRTRERIEHLEKVAALPERAPEVYGDVEIREDRDANRVQIRFPGKPAEDVRALMRSRGFRWAPSTGAWQRQASFLAWRDAQEIARKVSGVSAPAAAAPEPTSALPPDDVLADAFGAFTEAFAEEHGPTHDGVIRRDERGPFGYCPGCEGVWRPRMTPEGVQFDREEEGVAP